MNPPKSGPPSSQTVPPGCLRPPVGIFPIFFSCPTKLNSLLTCPQKLLKIFHPPCASPPRVSFANFSLLALPTFYQHRGANVWLVPPTLGHLSAQYSMPPWSAPLPNINATSLFAFFIIQVSQTPEGCYTNFERS